MTGVRSRPRTRNESGKLHSSALLEQRPDGISLQAVQNWPASPILIAGRNRRNSPCGSRTRVFAPSRCGFRNPKRFRRRQHFQLQQESAPITERAYRNLKSEQGSASCNRRQRGHIRRRPMLRGEHQVSQPKSRTQPTATSSYGLSEIGLATGTCAATQRAN